MATTSSESSQGIKSIEVGARVLLALERNRGPMTLSEVAAGSGMHPAKVHRYLASLVRVGLASQSVDTGLYDLGPASRRLGVEALRRNHAIAVTVPHAVALRDATGHTVNAAVWSEEGPVIVRWEAGTHALPIVIRVGSVLPLLDSAVGVVFYAYMPQERIASVLHTQQQQAATRSLSLAQAQEIAATVRRDGYASTRDQMILGLAALAAPVFGDDGSVEVVIGLITPTRVMSAGEAKRLARELREAAGRASRELGFADA